MKIGNVGRGLGMGEFFPKITLQRCSETLDIMLGTLAFFLRTL